MNNENKHNVAPLPEQHLTGITLMPDETLESVETYKHGSLLSYSAIEAIINLTAVHRYRDIGGNGPSNASNSVEKENDGKESHQGLYDVFFPRDAFVVAQILSEENPQLTRSTVLAAFAGMGVMDNYKNPVHPYDEQEVGKIPHEFRSPDDPIATELTEKKDWGWPYYGAVDTTGKNTAAIARYVETSDEGEAFLEQTFVGRDGIERTVKDGLDMNVAWLTNRMDLNPDGLVESLSKNRKHHANQTWADSPEAFHHADGSWAEHHPDKNLGVAALEQQGEAYAALRGAARMYERLGETDKADELDGRADSLREVVLEKFWVDDDAHYGGFFGRGTDRDEHGNLRVLAIRTSDMGNFLGSGMLDDTDDEELNKEIRFKREAVIQNLLSEEMLGLNGIRTLSSDSVRYSPDRYHNGTTWPWVTHVTAEALRRYGRDEEADDLDNRIMIACEETGILGEYFSGSNDPNHRLVEQRVVVANPSLTTDPVYPVSQPAQEIQAWTAAAVLAIKRRRGKQTLAA